MVCRQSNGGLAFTGTGAPETRRPGLVPRSAISASQGAFCRHCDAWRGTFGLEPTYQLYIAHAVEVFREIRRVLRRDGTLWLNMGDSYAHGKPGGGCVFENGRTDGRKFYQGDKARGRHKGVTLSPGLKPKDLVGMPWRLALVLQDDGWWLRQDIIWHKPAPMPESVRDRCTKAHEYLFLLARSERYYYDAKAIKEAADRVDGSGNKARKPAAMRGIPRAPATGSAGAVAGSVPWKGKTRNKRSVWTIAAQPYTGAHFATFPPKLIEPAGKLWYEELEQRVYMVLAESNWYTTFTQAFRDVTTFATSPILIYEDVEDVVRCHCPVVGEYFLQVGPTFRTEGFSRLFVLTVAQLVEMFGLASCPPEVQQLWGDKQANLEKEFVVAHAIEPNFPIQRYSDSKAIGVVAGGFTWRELFWLYGRASPQPLSRRGFRDLPLIALHWAANGNDPYGTGSAGMETLGLVMQLQQETRRKAELLEKTVRPPLNAPPELKNQPSSMLPGHRRPRTFAWVLRGRPPVTKTCYENPIQETSTR